MSFRVYVLGRRKAEIARREIAEFIHEGCFFDAPGFEPDPRSAEAAELGWTRFDIFERSGSTPFTLHSEEGHRVANIIDVVAGTFDERGLALPSTGSAHLEATRHVYVVELDRGGGISEDGWAMLSSVEVFLAKRCAGIIFSSEDGVYDAELRRAVDFRAE